MRALLLTFLLLLPSALLAQTAGSTPARQPEATSLLGRPLYPREISAETRTRLEGDLAAAEAAYRASPDDPDAVIWVGRRLGYLERYQDAIRTFSAGIEKHPRDARLYRHRGHRYLSVRQIDRAIADFETAAGLVRGQPDEVEPDGAPNASNIPTSTLQSNIWYHLGLAYYLKEDWENALRAYREAMKVSTNPDMMVATADWLYMTLRRAGRDAEARAVLEPIHAELEILENDAYLRRLLMYKGEIAPDALLAAEGVDDLTVATQGYGVGNWYLYNGEPQKAREVFQRVVDGPYWAAFGYLAAEAELARK